MPTRPRSAVAPQPFAPGLITNDVSTRDNAAHRRTPIHPSERSRLPSPRRPWRPTAETRVVWCHASQARPRPARGRWWVDWFSRSANLRAVRRRARRCWSTICRGGSHATRMKPPQMSPVTVWQQGTNRSPMSAAALSIAYPRGCK